MIIIGRGVHIYPSVKSETPSWPPFNSRDNDTLEEKKYVNNTTCFQVNDFKVSLMCKLFHLLSSHFENQSIVMQLLFHPSAP